MDRQRDGLTYNWYQIQLICHIDFSFSGEWMFLRNHILWQVHPCLLERRALITCAITVRGNNIKCGSQIHSYICSKHFSMESIKWVLWRLYSPYGVSVLVGGYRYQRCALDYCRTVTGIQQWCKIALTFFSFKNNVKQIKSSHVLKKIQHDKNGQVTPYVDIDLGQHWCR